MGIVHAKTRRNGYRGDSVDKKYNFGSDEAGLFEFEEELELDEEPVLAANIALNGVRARVDRVNVDGLNRTKDDVIKDTVEQMFQADDFEEVIMRANKVRQDLDNLGCFGNICVLIDVSSGPDATPDGLEVTFQVRELSRVVGGVTTAAGEDEGNLVLGVKLPNLLGRGERAAAAYSVGYRNTCSFNLTVTKPLPTKPFHPVVSGSVYQQSQEYPWSGYRLLDRGVLLDCTFNTSPAITHSVQWEGLVREMSVLNKTSFKIREGSGPQLKSMLRHTLSVEGRDQAVFPTRGAWLQLRNEVAGAGGDVAHLRHELRAQANCTLSDRLGVVVQASGALGVLCDAWGTRLPDNFFLGGATSLRGFGMRGVGPHVDGQALGGRVYWLGGVHVYSPLPLTETRAGLGALVRSHAFLTAGCLAFPERRELAPRETVSALSLARVSAGAGLCVALGKAARLELHYVLPLRAEPGDVLAGGLQFGVGANFL